MEALGSSGTEGREPAIEALARQRLQGGASWELGKPVRMSTECASWSPYEESGAKAVSRFLQTHKPKQSRVRAPKPTFQRSSRPADNTITALHLLGEVRGGPQTRGATRGTLIRLAATASSVGLGRVCSQAGPSVFYWVATDCVAEGSRWAVCKGPRPPFSPATPSVGEIQSLGGTPSVFLLGLYPSKTAELIRNVGKPLVSTRE